MNADLAERLSKLIPRLSTDHDPEVVATVRAIGRALKTGGMDFHDLAAELTTPTHRGSPFWDSNKAAKPKPPSPGLYTSDGFLRPWNQVIGEILERHETIPKRYGGKFLTKEQILRLERIYRGEDAPHDHESMIKLIDNRLNAAWNAQKAHERKKAA